MSSESSPEESRKPYLECMGDELGEYFYALHIEVVWVHARWQQYRGLFAEPENVDTLKNTAAFLFSLIQDALWEQTLLHIARLTDPPRSAGRENLTIRALPQLIQNDSLATEIDTLVQKAVDSTEYARQHRNRRLAHRDLNHVLEPTADPLGGISREYIENMLRPLRNVMNRVDHEYRDAMVVYEMFVANSGADHLISRLRKVQS